MGSVSVLIEFRDEVRFAKGKNCQLKQKLELGVLTGEVVE